jgi:hypothetical protein
MACAVAVISGRASAGVVCPFFKMEQDLVNDLIIFDTGDELYETPQ